MGLLDKQEPTQEEKIFELRKNITTMSKKLYSKMNSQHMQIFQMIWGNQNDLTAQEIFDEYGTDAAQLFLFSQNIQNMLAQADPSYIPLVPPYPYTINGDGTVTVDYLIDDNPSGVIDDPSIGDE